MANEIIIDDDHIIGMPPGSYISDTIIHNSYPVAEIIPSVPKFTGGQTVFDLSPAWSEYGTLLRSLGYSTSTNSLRVAFLADSFPTDTFSNEYGDSFLEKFTDVASQGLSDVSQFFGASSIGQLAKNTGATGLAEKLGGGLMEQGKSFLSGIPGMEDLAGAGSSLLKSKIVQTASAMAAGGRIDFPKVWKNSSFQPSYSITIRLYNPLPGNVDATKKYIVGPLAALLLLAVPRTPAEGTYTWPFFESITCNGIFELTAAYISSIAVIKGGDQQSIAHNQSLSIVDVRIDFGSLYDSILASSSLQSTRPTLANYLNNLTQFKELQTLPTETAPTGVSADYNTPLIDTVEYVKNISEGEISLDTQAPSRVNVDTVTKEEALAISID